MNIVFITTSNLTTNPRLVKELRLVLSLGHSATVFLFSFNNWSRELDDQLLREFQSRVTFNQLPGDRTKKLPWLMSSLLRIVSLAALQLYSSNIFHLSLFASKRSYLLFRALRKYKGESELVIAHNPGSFVPAMLYSRKKGIKLAIDVEDYHPGEANDVPSIKKMEILMRHVLKKADVITAASPLILEESLKLGVKTNSNKEVINNVFSKTKQPSFKDIPAMPLKLVWFSQVVGWNRGLQDVIRAMNIVNGFSVHLTVIGTCPPENKRGLEDMLSGKRHLIDFRSPVEECELIEICSRHHIGLALEPGFSRNNHLALSNKLFTYLLCGNAVIASDTLAQKGFLNEHREIGKLYRIGDHEALADILCYYGSKQQELLNARRFSYRLAQEKFNWEVESQKLIELYQL